MSPRTRAPETEPETSPPYLLDRIFEHLYTEPDLRPGAEQGAVVDTLLKKTLQNLAELPPPNKMPGKPLKEGVIGFKRNGRSLTLTVGCGRAIVRQIELLKFVSMLEKMKDDDATVVLENFSDGDEYKASRGQTLGRFNPVYSCFTIAQGLTGRVIHGASDVVRMDAYYLNKEVLAAFYLSCKFQLGMEGKLSELIGAYDGWKVFELPVDPCNPDGEVDDDE
jgi:hypothetical protein